MKKSKKPAKKKLVRAPMAPPPDNRGLEFVHAFLTSQGYAAQSIRNTMFQAGVLKDAVAERELSAPYDLAQPHRRTHLKRIIAACDAAQNADPEQGDAQALQALAQEVLAVLDKRPKGLRGGRKDKLRKRSAQSVDDAGWRKLTAALEKKEGGAARVLQLEASTGLRVGDILRIPIRVLREGYARGSINLTQKGGKERMLLVEGAPQAWGALVFETAEAKLSDNVASAISKSPNTTSSGAAYAQCRRLLLELQEELGLDRLHTHRLRRTIAVQALRETGDIVRVGAMIGHAPGSPATAQYLDEVRANDTAALSKKIAEKFRGKEG